MYFNRWIVFCAACFLQASAGLNYCFSVFAPALKDLFHLDEVQLGCIATLGFNMGGYFAIVSGAVYDYLGGKNHIGPRVVAVTGAALLFTGYFGIYSIATGLLPYNYVLLIVFAFCSGNAGCFFDTCSLATCVKNYPNDRGTVVGILKSFLGLTATIYTAVYVALFQPNALQFLLFLALCPSSIAVLLSVFINRVPAEYHDDPPPAEHGGYGAAQRRKDARFALVYGVVATLALTGMATAIFSSSHHLGGFGRRAIVYGLLALLALLLLVPLSAGPCTHPRRRHLRRGGGSSDASSGDVTASTPLLQQGTEQQQEGARGLPGQAAPQKLGRAAAGEEEEEGRGDQIGEKGVADAADGSKQHSEDDVETPPALELTPWQAARTLTFWLIVFQALMGVGTGLALLNNITGLVIALGGNMGGQVVFVSLFSVSNASGRLVFGYVSESFLHSRGTPRTVFLLIVSACMTAFAACMCFASLPDLYAMALLGGFAFGGHWATIPTIIADLFGIKHYASTYTLVQFSPAAGGYLLGTLLVGSLYEAAKAAGPSAGEQYCIGTGCYRTTWIVLTALNVLSLLGTRVLMGFSWSAYAHMRQRAR